MERVSRGASGSEPHPSIRDVYALDRASQAWLLRYT